MAVLETWAAGRGQATEDKAQLVCSAKEHKNRKEFPEPSVRASIFTILYISQLESNLLFKIERKNLFVR